MKENQENNCQNCKHFARYFLKANLKYKPTSDGFCANIYVRAKRGCQKIVDCKYWEKLPDKNNEILSIDEEMRSICKRIKEIADYITNTVNQ